MAVALRMMGILVVGRHAWPPPRAGTEKKECSVAAKYSTRAPVWAAWGPSLGPREIMKASAFHLLEASRHQAGWRIRAPKAPGVATPSTSPCLVILRSGPLAIRPFAHHSYQAAK
ncbi:hypothetical protein HDV57DRAFT_252699 [Trichoderma longibrachiatum]